MASLRAFTFVTINGFTKGPDEDISWHRHGEEEEQYSVESLAEDPILVFGRVTYDHMAAFWPTSAATEQFPEVARAMNAAA